MVLQHNTSDFLTLPHTNREKRRRKEKRKKSECEKLYTKMSERENLFLNEKQEA